MSDFSRRDFLKAGAGVAAMLGMAPALAPKVARALETMAQPGQAPVVWLQGQSCSGCSVSLLNSTRPGPADILTRYISLWAHYTIGAPTGELCGDVLQKAREAGGYLLVVEGSVPAAMPQACILGGRPFGDVLLETAAAAKAVIAVGACATFGGIPAAQGNLTGAMGAAEFFRQNKLDKQVINLPGCPMHPDWLVGTLVHLLQFGPMKLDQLGRPEVFFGRPLHDQCPRFADYERERFAKFFGDEGCLFKLGCLGPVTRADCTTRRWNNGTTMCIEAGAPCIGCAWEEFASRTDFPFYRKG